MATKKAKTPVWSVSATCLSGEAICTGGWFNGLCWMDGERLVTLDQAGQLVRWGRKGSREEVMRLGVGGVFGLWRLDARRVVARAGSTLWVVDAQAWAVTATLTGICGAYSGVEVGRERVVVAWPWGLAVHKWEGEALREVMKIQEVLPDGAQHGVYTMAPGERWLTAAYNGRVLRFDLRRGTARELGELQRVVTLADDGATGLAWCRGERGWSWGVAQLETGAQEVVWGKALPSLESGEQVEDGWIMRGEHALHRVDEAGEARWSWGSAGRLLHAARSPDGARVAVQTSSRVVILDAATGEVEGIEGLEGHIAQLGVLDEPAQLVAMVYDQPYSYTRRAHRWGLDGTYLGWSSWRHVAVADGALYGESYADSYKITRQLERWTEEGGAEVLGPIEPTLAPLCVEGGAVFYTAYAGGRRWSWTLRRAADDGAGWQSQIVATRPRAPLSEPMVGAGGLVAVVISAKQVDVYEAATGVLRYSLKTGGKNRVSALFSRDGSALYTLGDSKLHCWDMATGQARWEAKASKVHTGPSAMRRDGRYLVRAASWQAILMVYDAASGAEMGEVRLDTPQCTAMVFGPDDALYLMCQDGQLYRAELPC